MLLFCDRPAVIALGFALLLIGCGESVEQDGGPHPVRRQTPFHLVHGLGEVGVEHEPVLPRLLTQPLQVPG